MDEHGNPLHHHGTADNVDHQTVGYCEHVTPAGALRRSGSSSSSSSSSEDDGLGGRSKKNKGGRIKEKIKQKLPGGHKNDQNAQQQYAPGVAAGSHYDHGVAATEQTHEKKGMMERIKEKLPGSHSH